MGEEGVEGGTEGERGRERGHETGVLQGREDRHFARGEGGGASGRHSIEGGAARKGSG